MRYCSIALAFTVALALGACGSSTTDRAASGAGIGAGTGAVVGAISAELGAIPGALIGAGVGGANRGRDQPAPDRSRPADLALTGSDLA